MAYDSVQDLLKAVDMYTQLYHKKCEELNDHKQMLGEMFEEMEWERNRRHELADRVAELEAAAGLEYAIAMDLAQEVSDICKRRHVCNHQAMTQSCQGCNYDDAQYIYGSVRQRLEEASADVG